MRKWENEKLRNLKFEIRNMHTNQINWWFIDEMNYEIVDEKNCFLK